MVSVDSPRRQQPSRESERRATPLETFYDLVFAVALTAIGTGLNSDPTWSGALRSLALFIPIWWAWLGHTVYNTRFDNDDVVERLCTLFIMLAAAAMAVQVPHTFVGASTGFAAAYVGARVGLLLLYAQVWHRARETRAIVGLYLGGFGVGAACWAVSIAVPPPTRYILWAAGLGIDLALPWVGRPILKQAPVDTAHLPERLALFTIIVLGSIITLLVAGVLQPAAGVAAYVAAAVSFGYVVCIWWAYFTFIDTAPFAERLGSGQPYMYLHLPILAGLLLVGVGLEQSITAAAHVMLSGPSRWMLGGGTVLWLTAALGLHRASLGSLQPVAYVRFGGAALIVALLTGLGGALPPLVLLGGIVLSVLIFTVFDVSYWTAWRHEHAPAGGDDDQAEQYAGQSGVPDKQARG